MESVLGVVISGRFFAIFFVFFFFFFRTYIQIQKEERTRELHLPSMWWKRRGYTMGRLSRESSVWRAFFSPSCTQTD
ncbi:uncharacterized protein K452DRAFT_38066 [Aplosporella prunicola CBS 121167]|uniref:Uncharacterized protein n=1 Tax=Aplosporella prunicola CBS 121167 TaxID=1176127 RepID=A0A6A6BDF7_9PEZI|nr:uncharacterized protein K452DRAFT_38066 [Aplosporella prunicola CBS 121167]KAF2141325.1 hypothetical protein K452DRAFT_38066 [Aplosporella prunicola CBS 121167]